MTLVEDMISMTLAELSSHIDEDLYVDMRGENKSLVFEWRFTALNKSLRDNT
jgi:hypothetical protein